MIVAEHPLRFGTPPIWANNWGHDALGPWCAIEIENVEQTLRWIPPGQFQMGSPVDDSERQDIESPQHWVTISSGFWIFDTPCTQEFWHAVIGESPSHFKGPNRPVENISWDDCHRFISKLNERIPELNLALPSEAQWEYACRAGSSTSRYGELDAIAWFDINSKKMTHEVKLKQPNAWGLYDMLGNVWEWCHDSWLRTYTNAPATDPLYEEKAAPPRVIRGGSWDDSSQFARAAYRNADNSPVRPYDLGFRCLSSVESSPSNSAAAEMSGSESEPLRSRPDRERESPRSGKISNGDTE
jgi:formylglycine-generating enzyme